MSDTAPSTVTAASPAAVPTPAPVLPAAPPASFTLPDPVAPTAAPASVAVPVSAPTATAAPVTGTDGCAAAIDNVLSSQTDWIAAAAITTGSAAQDGAMLRTSRTGRLTPPGRWPSPPPSAPAGQSPAGDSPQAAGLQSIVDGIKSGKTNPEDLKGFTVTAISMEEAQKLIPAQQLNDLIKGAGNIPGDEVAALTRRGPFTNQILYPGDIVPRGGCMACHLLVMRGSEIIRANEVPRYLETRKTQLSRCRWRRSSMALHRWAG